MDYNSAMVTGYFKENLRQKMTSTGEVTCAFTLKSERAPEVFDFIDCVAKGEVAERIINSYKAEKRVTVVGRVQTRGVVGDDNQKSKRTEISVKVFFERAVFPHDNEEV